MSANEKHTDAGQSLKKRSFKREFCSFAPDSRVRIRRQSRRAG